MIISLTVVKQLRQDGFSEAAMPRKKEGARRLGPYAHGKGWRVIEIDDAGRRKNHYLESLAAAERLVLAKPLPASAYTPLTEGRKIERLKRARSPGIAGLNDKLQDAAPYARVCLAALVELLGRDEPLRRELYAAVERSRGFMFWPRLIPRPVLVPQDAPWRTPKRAVAQSGPTTPPAPERAPERKQKANPRMSARSIAAELMSIFEKGNEDDDQGENGLSDSRDGEEVVRGASQEQAD